MERWVLAAVLLAGGAAAAGAAPPASAPAAASQPEAPEARAGAGAAVLTSPRGTVEIRRGSTWEQVTYTTLLSAGEEARVAADKESGASLLLADGRVLDLAPGETARAPAAPAEAEAGFAALRHAPARVLNPGGAPLDRGGYVLRGFDLRGPDAEAPIVALSPRTHPTLQASGLAMVLDGQPTFRFRTPPATTGLTLTVMDDQQRKTFWSAPVPASAESFAYPRDQARLAPGAYVWILEGRVQGKAENDDGSFMVPSPSEARQAQADLAAARRASEGDPGRMALVGACLRYRLFDAAEEQLRAAWKLALQDRTLPLLLARLYRDDRDRTPPPELEPK